MTYTPQFDSTDCGAACLTMIASAFGSRWSLSKVRDLAGTDRHGTNLNGLVIAAQALGFEAKALKSASKALPADVPVPFIAHLNRGESGNHYVVVTRYKKDTLWISDPDPLQGQKKVSKTDFDREWTGFAVFLSPTPDFKPEKTTGGKLSRYLPLFRPHVGAMVRVVFASVLLTLLGLVGAFYFSYIVDEVLPAKAEMSLHVLSLGIILLTFFQVTLGTIRSHMLIHFSTKTSLALNFSYLRHVFDQPLRFFENRKVGEILSRLGDGEVDFPQKNRHP